MDKFTIDFFEVFREMVFDKDGNVIAKPTFNPAEQTAFDCYCYSVQNGSTVNGKNIFECNTLPTNKTVDEFIDLLYEAELKEITVTTETGLFDFLQTIYKYGCRINGVCKVNHLTDTAQGIIIQL